MTNNSNSSEPSIASTESINVDGLKLFNNYIERGCIKTHVYEVDNEESHYICLKCDCGHKVTLMDIHNFSCSYTKAKCSKCYSLLYAYTESSNLITKIYKPTDEKDDRWAVDDADTIQEDIPDEWMITYELCKMRSQYIY